MAAGDHAILLGISRYLREDYFKPLDGPLNDIERISAWLRDDEGVPEKNIHMLPSPADLVNGARPVLATDWTPSSEHFAKALYRLVEDEHGNPLPRGGRLYLFCAGHGFSMAKDPSDGAAVYGADATERRPKNIAAGLYAEIMRRGAYFQEIVLIMDCCRDFELDAVYTPPDLTTAVHDHAARVKVLSLYATPQRGKALERVLPEAGNKVHGLLTHGFLKALADAPADVLGRISSSSLHGYMANYWTEWFSDPKPPAPRMVIPQHGHIFFQKRASLVEQTIALTDPSPGAILLLQSDDLMAHGTVGAGTILWQSSAWRAEVPLSESHTFTLKLAPVAHTLGLRNAMAAPLSFQPGADHAIRI